MTCEFHALTFDAADPYVLAAFWADLLGYWLISDSTTIEPEDGPGLRIRFVANAERKTALNRMHFDLTSNQRPQQHVIDRALALGAQHYDVGQKGDEGHVVLADPERNEFCAIEEGNRFLAGCGVIGALSCDGSQANGYFWRDALGWPLVWDEGTETALQPPDGSFKITWGGEPVTPKTARNRLRLDLVTTADSSLDSEVGRLVALGARVLDSDPGEPDRLGVMLADPDGNEFRLR